MAENPLSRLVPSDSIDTSIPLYVSVGLTQKDSDDAYYQVNELLKKGDTSAQALMTIADNPAWSSRKKAYAAYMLHKEILRAKTPSHLRWAIDKLGF
jgi:hypothetical protein